MSDSATPWTAADLASLSITNSQSLLKLMSIESVMPSNHLILCCPLFLPPSFIPSIRVFSNESVLIRWSKYWSFSFSISPSMNIQDWFPLGWTGWISLLSKRLSRVFSSTTVQKHSFFGILEWAVKWAELPYPGVKPESHASLYHFTTEPLGKPRYNTRQVIYKKVNSFPAKAERFRLFWGLPGKDRTRVHSRPGSFLFLLCHLE